MREDDIYLKAIEEVAKAVRAHEKPVDPTSAPWEGERGDCYLRAVAEVAQELEAEKSGSGEEK